MDENDEERKKNTKNQPQETNQLLEGNYQRSKLINNLTNEYTI